MTLTFKVKVIGHKIKQKGFQLNLYGVRMNHRAKYLSDVISFESYCPENTHTHTHTMDTLLYQDH